MANFYSIPGSIVWRIFGKCKAAAEEGHVLGNWLSLTEFCFQFPSLWAYSCGIIREIAEKSTEHRGSIRDPRLYPVLSLLRNVGVVETDHEDSHVFPLLLK